MPTRDRTTEKGGTLQRIWRANRAGRVPLSWSLAGGILAGGFLLLSVSLSGTASSSAAPGAVGVLFTLGAMAGLVHGGILAYLARDPSHTRRQTLTSLLLAVAGSVVLAPLAWFVALHLALTLPFLDRGIFAVGGVALSWILGLSTCLWAAWEGWAALRRAFVRWPERRIGTLILTLVLAFLATRFVLERPAIWGTDVQVKGVGAMILALGATLWIALPIVLAVLHGAHRLLGDRFFADPDSNVNSSAPGV